MDIRGVVDILAKNFPDASADQVEQTVAELAGIIGETATGEDRAIVTVYGRDRPGILASVTAVVSNAGHNILDVSQKILQGYFALIMLIEVGEHGVGAVQDELARLAESESVRAVVQHEQLFNAMHRL